jgi:hypothetical protein
MEPGTGWALQDATQGLVPDDQAVAARRQLHCPVGQLAVGAANPERHGLDQDVAFFERRFGYVLEADKTVARIRES